MSLEKALTTSLECEKKVRDLYRDAEARTSDQTGKDIFRVLAEEEQGHIDYLESLLAEWKEKGAIRPGDLETVVPSREHLDEELRKLEAGMADVNLDSDLQMLGKALDLEIESTCFYRRMAEEVPPDHREVFDRFLAIEEGHVSLVKAQLDYLIRTGYWFDFVESDQDGA